MLNKEPRWAKPKFHGLKCDIHKVEDPCERSGKGQGVKVQLLKKCQVEFVHYRSIVSCYRDKGLGTTRHRAVETSTKTRYRDDTTPSCRVALPEPGARDDTTLGHGTRLGWTERLSQLTESPARRDTDRATRHDTGTTRHGAASLTDARIPSAQIILL